MKYYLRVFLAVLFSSGILVSCKKENAKDDSGSIKEKTWWGEFTLPNGVIQRYSVHFNANSTLTWSQLSGDYPGKWTMKGKHLTMSVDGNSVKMQADISNDGKLVNITDNTGSSEINSGQLIVNPKIAIENTVWKGSFGGSSDCQLSFLDGSRLNLKCPPYILDESYAYTRSPSGVVIRYGISANSKSLFIGIMISANEIKGNDDSRDMFYLIKQ